MLPMLENFPRLFEKPAYWPERLEWPPPLASLGPERGSGGAMASNTHQGIRARDLENNLPTVAGILLWLGELDQSHDISQGLSDVDGAYWHGLMHRREPDHANAGYWFRKVGKHPIHATLGQILGDGNWKSGEVKQRSSQKALWDMSWMNDLCKRAMQSGEPTLVNDLEALQWTEYRLLLDYSAGVILSLC